MLGPVLYLEMLLGGRRGRQHIFRWLYGAWIVGQLLFYYAMYRLDLATSSWGPYGYGRPDPAATGRFAGGFVEMFVVQQFLLVLLATPAFTAGAITDEKTRGTLQHLLTAHLTAGEIVLGKLLGRLAQVGILVLAGLPALCFIGVFAGLDPPLLLAVLAATAVPLFALGAASILVSVWSRQTRDAVLILYTVGAGCWLMLWGTPQVAGWLVGRLPPGGVIGRGTALVLGLDEVLHFFNPLYVLEPAWTSSDMATVGIRLLHLLLAWGSVGIGCLLLATWRLRAAYVRQLENSGTRARKDAPVRRPPVDSEDPVRWREQHVGGMAVLPALRNVPTITSLILVGLATLVLSGSVLVGCVPDEQELTLQNLRSLPDLVDPAATAYAFLIQAIGAMLVFSLIVGIRCSGLVSGEREKQTWEALLLTPLETEALVRGKMKGVMTAALPYLGAYAVPALAMAAMGGFASLFWTGLGLLVTLLAMYYVGAAGLWCSVTSRSSWRSLLWTLGFGYLGGFLLFVLASPFAVIVAAFLYIFLQIVADIHGASFFKTIGFSQFFFGFLIGMGITLVGIFFFAARIFQGRAEAWVANRERIRHWKHEPLGFRRGGMPLARNEGPWPRRGDPR